jgi:hypothetical protein
MTSTSGGGGAEAAGAVAVAAGLSLAPHELNSASKESVMSLFSMMSLNLLDVQR